MTPAPIHAIALERRNGPVDIVELVDAVAQLGCRGVQRSDSPDSTNILDVFSSGVLRPSGVGPLAWLSDPLGAATSEAMGFAAVHVTPDPLDLHLGFQTPGLHHLCHIGSGGDALLRHRRICIFGPDGAVVARPCRSVDRLTPLGSTPWVGYAIPLAEFFGCQQQTSGSEPAVYPACCDTACRHFFAPVRKTTRHPTESPH